MASRTPTRFDAKKVDYVGKFFTEFSNLFLDEIVSRLDDTDILMLSYTSRSLSEVRKATALPKKSYRVYDFMQSEARMRWAIANGCELDERLCSYAAVGGHLAVLKGLRDAGCAWDEDVCECAASGNHIDVLQWARLQGCPWNGKTCGAAAASGLIETLQWVRTNGCPWNANTCARAARTGNFEVLRWARENGCSWSASTCACAAEGGFFDILKWAHSEGCPLGSIVFEGAAINGDIVILDWLWSNECAFDGLAANYAAGEGHVHVLEWMEAMYADMIWEFDCRSEISAAAAENGHIAVLSWVLATGYPMDEDVFEIAARAGHLETLQWLHTHVIRSDETEDLTFGALLPGVCEEAAAGGRLNVLVWLYANKAEFVDSMFGYAASGGHVSTLKWLVEHAEGDIMQRLQSPRLNLCVSAAESGNIFALQWLRDHGCFWDERVSRAAARYGHLALLKWVDLNKCPLDNNLLLSGARGGHLEVVKWAFIKQPESHAYLSCASEVACEAGYTEIFEWLLQNGSPLTIAMMLTACGGKHLYLTRKLVDANLHANDKLSFKQRLWIGQDLEDLDQSSFPDEVFIYVD
jgi:hypothetical protein